LANLSLVNDSVGYVSEQPNILGERGRKLDWSQNCRSSCMVR
jgi:hypothetical protein